MYIMSRVEQLTIDGGELRAHLTGADTFVLDDAVLDSISAGLNDIHPRTAFDCAKRWAYLQVHSAGGTIRHNPSAARMAVLLNRLRGAAAVGHPPPADAEPMQIASQADPPP